MSDLTDAVQFKKVSIDSTLELLADHFNAEAVGTTLFSNAAFGDTLNIQLGLQDPLGGPDQTITTINNGFIDEFEMTFTPTSQVVNLRGRDSSSLILDRFYEKFFIRANYVQGLSTPVYTSDVTAQIKAAQKTSILFPAGHLFEVGVFHASQIAAEIARSVGMTLLWQVRDYTLADTFVAKGRIAETLKALVEPWSIVEPFRADVYVDGKTIVVRYRQLPNVPMVPQYTFTPAQMRRSEIKIRKRFTKFLGRVQLLGMLNPVQGTDVTVIAPSDETVEITQESDAPDPNNQPGGLIKTFTTTRFRLPQNLVEFQQKQVFAPFLVLDESTFNDYDESDQGPLLVKSTTSTKEYDTDVNGLLDSKRVTKTVVYDQFNQVQNETIITEQFDTTANAWSGSQMNIKTYTDVAPQMVEVVTEEYVSVSTQGAGGNQLLTTLWSLTKRDSQIAAGHRAGGAGRGIFIPNSTNQAPIELDALLSTATFAEPFTYSNPNLNLSDLQFLLTLLKAQNNLSFEYEVSFSGVAMPWLSRGMVISIQGLTSTDGSVAITLPNLLITEVRTSYDESRKDAQFVTQARAFGWA